MIGTAQAPPLDPQRENLLNDHQQHDVTICLQVGSVLSAPPSSSHSIGQVHTPASATHLDELSALKQRLARGWRIQHRESWQQMLKKQELFEWLSTKNIFPPHTFLLFVTAVTFLPWG